MVSGRARELFETHARVTGSSATWETLRAGDRIAWHAVAEVAERRPSTEGPARPARIPAGPAGVSGRVVRTDGGA